MSTLLMVLTGPANKSEFSFLVQNKISCGNTFYYNRGFMQVLIVFVNRLNETGAYCQLLVKFVYYDLRIKFQTECKGNNIQSDQPLLFNSKR